VPTVAFQGIPGAFSEEAVRQVFDAPTLAPCDTFDAVFAAVEEETSDRAVVPIENAVFGSVHVNYDHLRAHDVTIVGELHLRIRHHLMAPAEATLDTLRTVYSHPQALGQCRGSLQQLVPQASTESAYDTAGAARDVADRGDPSTAAIASRRAADRYGLTVLARGLEDNEQNYTRFLVLAPSGADMPIADGSPRKTSIAFALRENVPGALFKSLAVFALRELDLLKIESRPLVGHPGRYVFYLDIDGSAESDAVTRALGHLDEISTEVQLLGSYPAGPTVDANGGTAAEACGSRV
jgi:prephenate dehydratase